MKEMFERKERRGFLGDSGERRRYSGSIEEVRRVEGKLRLAEGWNITSGESKRAATEQSDEVSRVQAVTYVVTVPSPKPRHWPFPSFVRVRLRLDYRSGTGTVEVRQDGLRRLWQYLPGLESVMNVNNPGGA